jgi:hypothetical protein
MVWAEAGQPDLATNFNDSDQIIKFRSNFDNLGQIPNLGQILII